MQRGGGRSRVGRTVAATYSCAYRSGKSIVPKLLCGVLRWMQEERYAWLVHIVEPIGDCRVGFRAWSGMFGDKSSALRVVEG